MSKIIVHVDLNAFFATAEEMRHPELAGKPIAVGGLGKRGVVSTASYKAREYGVRSGMPGYMAKSKCPELVFLPVDFDYYEMLSASFFAYLRRYTKLVEPASIDEGYMDLTEYLKDKDDPKGELLELQRGLLREIGLKCSIGVAPTKFLAKMASDMKKPMGLTFLRRRDLEAKLYPLPISSFWGIGKKSAPRLEEKGYKTIGDLAKGCLADDPWLVSFFGKGYQGVKDHCLGRGSDVVSPEQEDPKSLGRSLTFEDDTGSEEEILPVLERLCLETASALRREGKEGKTLTVSVRDTEFRNHSKSQTGREPIPDGAALYKRALSLYQENFLGMRIRLVGVSVSALANRNASDVQMSFFDYMEYEEKDKTRLLVQEWNRRLDGDYLKMLSQVEKKHGNN